MNEVRVRGMRRCFNFVGYDYAQNTIVPNWWKNGWMDYTYTTILRIPIDKPQTKRPPNKKLIFWAPACCRKRKVNQHVDLHKKNDVSRHYQRRSK